MHFFACPKLSHIISKHFGVPEADPSVIWLAERSVLRFYAEVMVTRRRQARLGR